MNKIDKYYNKILLYSKEFDNDWYIEKNEKEMKYYLNNIITRNKENILTDSILCYISVDHAVCCELSAYGSIDLSISIDFLKNYYESFIEHFVRRDIDYCLHFKLLNDDTKNMVITSYNIVKEIDRLNLNRDVFTCMLYTTLAYCHVKNRINEFNILWNNLFDNKELIIEDMKLNNLRNPDIFTIRIINILENSNNKRLIK